VQNRNRKLFGTFDNGRGWGLAFYLERRNAPDRIGSHQLLDLVTRSSR